MSATHPESLTVGSRDAPHGSASVAAAAAAHSAAASSSPAAAAADAALPPNELAAVKQRIAEVEAKIDAVEKKRDVHPEGSLLWLRYDDELKQLRTKEEQLRDELKRKEVAQGGER